MATQKKVQGNHIQYILQKILGFRICGGFTGTREKEDTYTTYELVEAAIMTNEKNRLDNEKNRIDIYYYWDYRLTVKKNLFTFPIVYGNEVNHIMKVLTDDEQIKILKYLGILEE
jgi:hypothetical protein